MFRRHFNLLSLTLLMITAISCNDSSGSGASITSEGPEASTSAIETVDSNQLLPADEEDLLFMWEEEKLARDVYTQMNKKYGKKIFANIAKSEQGHMDSVKKLLDQAKLSTPVSANAVGTFKNPDISSLYQELIERGNGSLYDAYQVGLDIELMDIKDLSEKIEVTTDLAIKKVYTKLLEASYNHKAAFEKLI